MQEYRQPVEGEGPHQGETEAEHVSPDEQEGVDQDVADET